MTGPGTTAGSAHRRLGLGTVPERGASQGLGHQLVERAHPPRSCGPGPRAWAPWAARPAAGDARTKGRPA